jgi:tetratricopeptide (TPR) repeat protein
LEDSVASDIGADLDDWHEDLPALDEQEASRPSAEVDFQALEPGASSEPMAADRGVAADGIAGAADRKHEDIAGEELVAVESDLAADLGREGLADLGPGSEFDAADATGANEQDETGEFSGTSAKTVRPAEPEPLQAIETPIRASAAALDGGVAASAEADNFGFDLAAELSQSFDRDPGASGSRGHSASGRGDTSEDGFASVFAEFKKGVSATLSEGDYQAHYDLGIAYREMGLLSDAITELRLAMNDPERRVGCLHLMGICANEMGEPEQAIGHLTAALSADGITGETVLAVKLDLGTSHQAIGDIASARRVYEEVHAVDPHFADVVSRLDELEKFEEVEAEDDGVPETDEYESFEEFAEDLDEPAAVESAAAAGSTADAGQAPVWESFDDFVAEVDTEDDADSALREADAVAPAEFATDAGGPESAELAAATETTPKRRKKKISFV